MDSTKVIADLCAVIDRMNVIIQAQAMELAQYGAVVHAEEIAEGFRLLQPVYALLAPLAQGE